ncbi:MAG TPA: YbaK/EbsC family protein [Gaiellaceae bacterium]|nr:YbaK/EbsC family protein [Gaiellaceae bacterium]
MSEWPEPVERVARALREGAGAGRIEEFPQGTPTAQAAAEAVGCEPAEIVKSIVIACDGRPVVALVPGDRRADPAKVAAALGAEKARVAGPEQVIQATGFEPGAVAPFPLPRVQAVLIERTLLQHELVWCGAGSPRHMLGIAPAELLRLARARPFDLVRHG